MGNAKSAEEGTPETSNDGAGANPKINTPEAKAKKKLEQKLKDAKSEKSSKSDKVNGTDAKCKQPLLPPAQREIIKFCISNSKDDLGERIYRRVMEKRDDFRSYASTLDDEQKAMVPDLLREFILEVVKLVLEGEDIESLCESFGERHVQLRANGFKPDFFATTADAVATECVFLDQATHQPTETLMAWSQLASAMFSSVRDGYYKELRRLRRASNVTAVSSKSEDLSEKRDKDEKKEDSEKKDDSNSSRSISPVETNENEENTVPSTNNVAKPETANFLSPPHTAY
ncbi:Protein GLB-11 [Aphelenchoides avenae]|nr:Protein GLB-11 [Aphelenchus avenae]